MPADIAAADRTPEVKICGIVDEDGVRAASAADADYIGLNIVVGTPRALDAPRAAALAAFARATGQAAASVVLVTADATTDEITQLDQRD